MTRKCIHCGRPEGPGPRELRPYGPNGTDVCAGCVLGEKNPERIAQAERSMSLQMGMSGPGLVLDTREQSGPRTLTSEERKRMGA